MLAALIHFCKENTFAQLNMALFYLIFFFFFFFCDRELAVVFDVGGADVQFLMKSDTVSLPVVRKGDHFRSLEFCCRGGQGYFCILTSFPFA